MTAAFYNSPSNMLKLATNANCRGIGSLGERIAYILLEKRGYIVSNVHPSQHRGDLRVVTADGLIFRVEVKTARRASDHRWHFTLRKKSHTDHAHSDIILLLCITKAVSCVPFVVPTPVLLRQNALVISSDPYSYAGKFSRFRQPMYKLNLEIDYDDHS